MRTARKSLTGGYMLTELLVCVFIFMLVLTAAVPTALQRRHERYAVDTAARELVTDLENMRIRAVANGSASRERWRLHAREREYTIARNVFTRVKKRKFGPNVVAVGGSMSFDAQGRPEDKEMRIIVQTKDKSYRREIIIAAQTGRVRLE